MVKLAKQWKSRNYWEHMKWFTVEIIVIIRFHMSPQGHMSVNVIFVSCKERKGTCKPEDWFVWIGSYSAFLTYLGALSGGDSEWRQVLCFLFLICFSFLFCFVLFLVWGTWTSNRSHCKATYRRHLQKIHGLWMNSFESSAWGVPENQLSPIVLSVSTQLWFFSPTRSSTLFFFLAATCSCQWQHPVGPIWHSPKAPCSSVLNVTFLPRASMVGIVYSKEIYISKETFISSFWLMSSETVHPIQLEFPWDHSWKKSDSSRWELLCWIHV